MPFVHTGCVYVYGGADANSKVLASVEEYKAGQTWRTLAVPLYEGDILFASVPNVNAVHTTSTQSSTTLQPSTPKSAIRLMCMSGTLIVAVLICRAFVVVLNWVYTYILCKKRDLNFCPFLDHSNSINSTTI
jgi:hypothetical protein